jgi:hypothetical protein
MSIKYTFKMDAVAYPPKKVQSQFFRVENAVCEHNGHKPDFWGVSIHVLKLTARKGQNGHL